MAMWPRQQPKGKGTSGKDSTVSQDPRCGSLYYQTHRSVYKYAKYSVRHLTGIQPGTYLGAGDHEAVAEP